jgi:co-chaperonin GroES (HSP10)
MKGALHSTRAASSDFTYTTWLKKYVIAVSQKQVCLTMRSDFSIFFSAAKTIASNKRMPIQLRKEIIVVGDRVLLELETGHDKTKAGLYLPDTVREKEKVATGRVVKVGPGYAIPNPSYTDDEPWAKPKDPARYIPLQVKEGDYALFLRDQAIEVEFEEKKYLVVPQTAILIFVRDELHEELG